MRIMHVNKYGYIKGGAEAYMVSAVNRQIRAGHEVAVLAGEVNPALYRPAVTTFNTAIPDFRALDSFGKVRAAKNVLWSKSSADRLRECVRSFEPDVVHLHNYAHQLSPAVISALHRQNVPSVYTAHDYKLVCPSYTAVRNEIDCFSCAKHITFRPIRDKCLHDDLAWSAVALAEAMEVRALTLIPKTIIAPSRFMKDALENSWLAGRAKISLLRNPVEETESAWFGGKYLLYVGRLSWEKGIMQLCRAAKSMQIPVVLAGEGPMRAEVKKYFTEDEVRLVGHVNVSELVSLRERCRAQIVPSTWPENAPLAALEAAAQRVPLILANRGGLPELPGLGAKGILLDETNAAELSRALEQLPDVEEDYLEFCRQTNWTNHMDGLQSVYVNAMQQP